MNAAIPIGLALSGGGSRSAAFSTGAIAALAQRGLLSRESIICSSSGGCIVNATLIRSRASCVDADSASQPSLILEDAITELRSMLRGSGLSPYKGQLSLALVASGTAAAFLLQPILYFDLVVELILIGIYPIIVLLIFYIEFDLKRASTSLEENTARWLAFSDDDSSRIPYTDYETWDTILPGQYDPREPGASWGIPVRTRLEVPLLSAAIESPWKHIFVASDLNVPSTVYFSSQGFSPGSNQEWEKFDTELHMVVADSMRFPGYATSRRLKTPGGRTLELVDGGLFDNLALSYFTSMDDSTRPNIIVCIDAKVAPTPISFRVWHTGRLGIFSRSMSRLHSRASILHLEFLARQQNVCLVHVQVPPTVRVKTTLRPLRQATLDQLFDFGFENTMEALTKAGL